MSTTMLLDTRSEQHHAARFGREFRPQVHGAACARYQRGCRAVDARRRAVGLGLAQAFERFPWLYTVLETASVVYLLYLAWEIGTSSTVQMRDGERRPMRFHEAFGFQ